ncbi:MAG: hypothetical protein HY000_36535 [Planctomycetes bacterium]|nr:hypothetical protein [Planctomycetota bacterium]
MLSAEATLSPQIMDDGDPGFSVTSETVWTTADSGLGRDGDFRYAFGANGTHEAVWSFDVTPGVYRVAATWVENPFYAPDAAFAVFDGAKGRGVTRLDQQQAPGDFVDQGSAWEDLGRDYYVTGNTLWLPSGRSTEPLNRVAGPTLV